MPFPTRQQLRTALLAYIYENGGSNRAVLASATYDPLADRCGVSPLERKVTRDEIYKDRRPEPAWHSIVQYARRDLVHQGLLSLDGGRGIWTLSAKGVQTAELVSRTPEGKFSQPKLCISASVTFAKVIARSFANSLPYKSKPRDANSFY